MAHDDGGEGVLIVVVLGGERGEDRAMPCRTRDDDFDLPREREAELDPRAGARVLGGEEPDEVGLANRTPVVDRVLRSVLVAEPLVRVTHGLDHREPVEGDDEPRGARR